MRLLGLIVAATVFVPLALLGQHSAGGGGSSSSGSASSSGGSHSYSGGSSGYSGGSRSSTSSTSSHTSSNSPARNSNSASTRSNPQPEHRGLRGFLHHPFRKPAAKPAEADLRLPICTKEPCPVLCPPGESGGGKGMCAANRVTVARNCPAGRSWNGAGCDIQPLLRVNDCSSLAMALQHQAQQAQLADSLRQSSCSGDAAAQECSELTADRKSVV